MPKAVNSGSRYVRNLHPAVVPIHRSAPLMIAVSCPVFGLAGRVNSVIASPNFTFTGDSVILTVSAPMTSSHSVASPTLYRIGVPKSLPTLNVWSYFGVSSVVSK